MKAFIVALFDVNLCVESQAGPSSESILEISVPAAIVRLFKHPIFDWGIDTLTQAQLKTREVNDRKASTCVHAFSQSIQPKPQSCSTHNQLADEHVFCL